jgi:hypothetical protein
MQLERRKTILRASVWIMVFWRPNFNSLSHRHLSLLRLPNKKQKLRLSHKWDKDSIEGKQGTEKMIAASWYGLIQTNSGLIYIKEESKFLIGYTRFTFYSYTRTYTWLNGCYC